MTAKIADAISTLHVLQGRNPVFDASRNEVLDSAKRYQGDPFVAPMSREELTELANVIKSAAPEEYQGYRVKTPEEVWRSRNKKTSPGFLFEGSIVHMTEEEDVPLDAQAEPLTREDFIEAISSLAVIDRSLKILQNETEIN